MTTEAAALALYDKIERSKCAAGLRRRAQMLADIYEMELDAAVYRFLIDVVESGGEDE